MLCLNLQRCASSVVPAVQFKGVGACLGDGMKEESKQMDENNIALFSAHATCLAWVFQRPCIIFTPAEGATTIWNIAGALGKVKKNCWGGSCSCS